MLLKILVLFAACLFTEAYVTGPYGPPPPPPPEPTDPPTTYPTPPPRPSTPELYPEDVVTYDTDLSCNISKHCPSGYACRDTNGGIIHNFNPGPRPDNHVENKEQGTCGCATRPGEVCRSDKDCPQNYLCYAQSKGQCCPVPHCYSREYVENWKTYWWICLRNISCSVPAK